MNFGRRWGFIMTKCDFTRFFIALKNERRKHFYIVNKRILLMRVLMIPVLTLGIHLSGSRVTAKQALHFER